MSEHVLTGDPVVIQMDGTFDVPAAQQVARALADATAGATVRIDLTHVREFHDFGVAVLAQALSARPIGVHVRGLGRHQRRLLAYLGIPAAGEEAAEPAEAEAT